MGVKVINVSNTAKAIDLQVPTAPKVITITAQGAPGVRGVDGAPGPKGDPGSSPTLTFRPVTTGPAGSNASLDVTSDGSAYSLGLTLPRGEAGNFTTIAAGATRPAGIANGTLVRRLGSYQNLVTNPRGVTPDTTVVTQRTNLIRTPSPVANGQPWSYFAGTGATAAATASPTGGPTNGGYVRLTWTVAGTNRGGHYITSEPITAGSTYTASAYVRSSVDTTIVPAIEWLNSVPANIGSSTGTIVSLTANTWTRISVSGTAVAGAVNLRLTLYAGGAAGSLIPAVGQTLDATMALTETGTQLFDYFDGATTNTKTITYAWTGTANASTSTLSSAYYEVRRNLATDPRATSINDSWGNRYGSSGTSATMTGRVDGPLSIPTYIRRTVSAGGVGTAISQQSFDLHGNVDLTGFLNKLPVSAGSSYTVSLYLRHSVVGRQGRLDARFFDASGNAIGSVFSIGGNVPLPINDWARLSGTAVAPGGAAFMSARVLIFDQAGTATSLSGETLDGTGLLIEQTASLRDYFDGSALDADPYVYEWSGTANVSQSVQRTRAPYDWLTSTFTTPLQMIDPDGTRFVRVVGNGGNAALLTSNVGFPANSGDVVTVAVKTRVSKVGASAALNVRARRRLTATGAIIVQSPSSSTLSATQWTWLIGRATIVTAATDWQTDISLNTTVGDIVDISDVLYIPGVYDGPFFDGDTGPGDWNGVPNASSSGIRPGTVSFWDGTNETWIDTSGSNNARTRAVQADLSSGTTSNISGTLVRRSNAASTDFNYVGLANAPSAVSHATRKDYVDTAAAAARRNTAISFPTANYTLALADDGKRILANSATATTFTIPTNASTAFPIGAWVEIGQWNTGAVTVTGATGVSLVGPNSAVSPRAQYSVIRVVKVATDNWIVEGDVPDSIAQATATATGDATGSTLVKRYSGGDATFSQVIIGTGAPVSLNHATRKDYVDNQDIAYRRIAAKGIAGSAGSPYIPALVDEGTRLQVNNTSTAHLIQVPADATVNFPVGAWFEMMTNVVTSTIQAEAGVTLRSRDGSLLATKAYGLVRFMKIAANTWLLTGDLYDSVASTIANATDVATANTLVKRDVSGNSSHNRLFVAQAPSAVNEATRKDYVDNGLAGKANISHTHAIADLTATGTKDATTFLRGDGTWAVPAGTGGGTGGSVTAANITDATAIGRTIITSADATAVRTAISAGTSNLVIGTTVGTAKDGAYQPSSANITDATAIGKTILTSTDATSVRAAIGAGVSNLVIGTTAGTAKDGAYQPSSANITDSTAIGRTVLTAADATAVRSAIGAGTSSLVIGTAAGTAAAGNDSRLSDARTPTAHAASHATGGSDVLTPAAIGAAATSHTHTASNISDSTTVGRSLVTATDATAARTAIGAGTSSLVIGTTAGTAKDGAWKPASTDITDATVIGKTILTSVDATAVRTAISAGTSSLVIGTTVGTAKDGAYQPTAANITDATAIGRTVLTSVDAPAVRTAIGAGTSSLTIGTTSATAAAGDHTHTPASIGAAAASHTHAIADLTATGTKDATTFLRGDGTWATPGSTVTSTNITDATAVGRSVLTATSAAAARSATGAGVVDSADGSILQIVKMTQAAYDALSVKIDTTLYVIVS